MKLYNFFRSGTSHRLRIALNLKGIATDYVAVDLRVEAHLKDAFKSVNPQQLVPALDTGEQVLIQSPAIIEWLEETHPTPALLPANASDRAATFTRSTTAGFWKPCASSLGPTKRPSTLGAAPGSVPGLTHTKRSLLPTQDAGFTALATPLG
jgi:glutathione S-transferase